MNKSLCLGFLIMLQCCSLQASQNVGQDLCSKEGLMKLLPQLKNAEGKFQIPDSSKNPKAFLEIHTQLSNLIEMALIKAQYTINPYENSTNYKPLKFPMSWRSAEVGVQTNGKKISFPDDQQFASYGGISFMSGISKLAQGEGYYYSVSKPDGTIPALVYVQPTVLPCVNRVDLAAANTAGSWLAPTYALGNLDGQAYLVVDKCLDLGTVTKNKDQAFLRPNAILFSAIHWADTEDLKHMRTHQKAHTH